MMDFLDETFKTIYTLGKMTPVQHDGLPPLSVMVLVLASTVPSTFIWARWHACQHEGAHHLFLREGELHMISTSGLWRRRCWPCCRWFKKQVYMLTTMDGPTWLTFPQTAMVKSRGSPRLSLTTWEWRESICQTRWHCPTPPPERTISVIRMSFTTCLTVVNAYMVHRMLSRTLSQLEFRLELKADLIHQTLASGRRGGL